MRQNKKMSNLKAKNNRIRSLIGTALIFSMIVSMFLCLMPITAYAEKQTFTVGFDAEFPPYGYKDASGEYVGFDLDLAAEVCKRSNWELVKQPIDWDSKDMELNSGAIDCIWNGFTINGREDKYTWSTPYIDNSQVVVVKKDSDINKLSDLEGKTVVVQADSSALAAFTGEDATDENKKLAKSFAELQQTADYNSAFLNLESGMVQAICMDVGVANYQTAKRGDKFRILEEKVSSEKYGIGFKLGNDTLRDKVQEILFDMKSDGTFDEIAKKWNLETSVCLSADDKYIDKEETSSSSQKTDDSGIKFGDMFIQLADGMKSTILIFVLTLLFSMPLGLLLTFIRMSRFKIIQMIAKLYISIIRGTPLMLQLLVVCYGPYYIFGWELGKGYRFYAGSNAQTFRKIIFPQMVKHVLPPVTNEIITLVKDTSLAFVLAYTEIFTIAKQIAAAQTNIIPLFAAGLFYYVFNFIVAFVMSRIEKKLSYYK